MKYKLHMKLLDTIMAVLVSLSGISDLETIENIDPQKFCMAQNIYFESRNESTAGKVAVMNVTMNRVNSEDFPNTICEVVYEGPHYQSVVNPELWYPYKNRCQFSWYCDGVKDKIANEKKFWEIFQLVDKLKNNDELIDLTDGALFYHADYVTPYWADKMRKKVVIDRHIFYHP